MKSIDLTFIVPGFVSFLSFLGLLVYGKRFYFSKPILRLIPLISVLLFFVSVFFINGYYKKQAYNETQEFQRLKKINYFNDSILLSNKLKNQTIDSLKLLNKKLAKILVNIRKQERIVGDFSNIQDEVNAKINKTIKEIGNIELYNEIIEDPSFKGYTQYNTNEIQFICPTEQWSDFIDLKFVFKDDSIINNIACIYIDIIDKRENGKQFQLFSQAYKPQKGVNAFKVRNYLKYNSVTLKIGYILLSSLNDEYPIYECVSCTSVLAMK